MNTRILFLLLFLLPLIGQGQSGPMGPQRPGQSPPMYYPTPMTPIPVPQPITNQQANTILQFTKGKGEFEEWFFEGIKNLDTLIRGESTYGIVLIGKLIAGLGMLVYLSFLGWKMQMGEQPWSVIPFIRPTVMAIFLINWSSFVNIIEAPFRYLADSPKATFETIERRTSVVRAERVKKQFQVLNAYVDLRASIAINQKSLWESIKSGEADVYFGNLLKAGAAPLESMMYKIDYKLQQALGDFIETIFLALARGAVYFIFIIQKVWSAVLVILGPISVGISFMPGFENSFNRWVTRFINISLYPFIAYTVVGIGQLIIQASYRMEISRLSKLVDSNGKILDMALLTEYANSNTFITSTIFSITAYLLTTLAIFKVPSIADSIVESGNSTFMQGATRFITKANEGIGKGIKAISKVASGGGGGA